MIHKRRLDVRCMQQHCNVQDCRVHSSFPCIHMMQLCNHCWFSEKLVVVEVVVVLDELYSCSAFTGSVQSRLVLLEDADVSSAKTI